jgi:RNA polymerase sigma factor (sigma-70 family)
MPHAAFSSFMHMLRRVAARHVRDEQADAELLARFVRRGDEAAFEVLVHRHGPMVWSVCRRLLTRTEDAEDAFQAAFVVLLRRAGSIRDASRLGNWLYGVTYRVAVRARARAAQRAAREKQGMLPSRQRLRPRRPRIGSICCTKRCFACRRSIGTVQGRKRHADDLQTRVPRRLPAGGIQEFRRARFVGVEAFRKVSYVP